MSEGNDANGKTGEAKPAVVKKYANRRLYNTATSSYVTLDELSLMVRQGENFVVFDAKTGDDITRSVLTQIILEEDSKGRNLLPIGFLRQLISFYDDSLHAVVPRYLEVSMENFSNHQDQMRDYMDSTIGRFFPVPAADPTGMFEDLAKQNMAFVQQAARMFAPFPGTTSEPSAADPAPTSAPPKSAPAATAPNDVEALKDQLATMQQQLNDIARRQKD